MHAYTCIAINLHVHVAHMYANIFSICAYNIHRTNGYQISWKHIVDLYNKLTDMASKSKGITFNTKLKREHIELTSFSRMRVDLAAQVVQYIQLYMITVH